MNIFYLFEDPKIAASMHCDKHIVKMILEYAQLLSTAHRMLDGTEKVIISDTNRKKRVWEHPTLDNELYGVTHRNHPSAVWVRKGISNYLWVYDCMWWCNQEFKRRYGHTKNHLTIDKLSALLSVVPKAMLDKENVPFTAPPQCMPDDCKQQNTVEAYRAYYTSHKYHIAVWRDGILPEWFKES